ncbi:MAG: BolA family protein [Candidatus Paracaedibacteraceae bacterium]|nr:BolA family protein [Candidatus Paracaedibacteraceae bacterium]
MEQNQTRALRIRAILTEALAPQYIELIDESHTHKGHGGVKEHAQNQIHSMHLNPDETHFSLIISAQSLKGFSRVVQHQKIYTLVADEFKSGLHSLRITVQI